MAYYLARRCCIVVPASPQHGPDRDAQGLRNDDGRLLYVLPGGGRKIKVVVAPDWNAKGRGTLNLARTVFKVDGRALRGPRRYTVIRGEVKK